MSATKDIGSITKTVQLQTTVTKTANFAGTEVDLGTDVESAIVIIDVHLIDVANADETYTFGLTHCDTSGGTFTAVTGGTGATLTTPTTTAHQALEIPSSANLKRYVKMGLVVAGTTPSAAYSASIVVAKRGTWPVT